MSTRPRSGRRHHRCRWYRRGQRRRHQYLGRGEERVDQAVDAYGSLDILVNNAGILRDKMSFNMDESDWDDVSGST